MKMLVATLLLCLVVFASKTTAQGRGVESTVDPSEDSSTVSGPTRRPPQITSSNPVEIIFRDDQDDLLLNCEATGLPPPTYEWWVKLEGSTTDKLLNLGTGTKYSRTGQGSMIINKPKGTEAGKYFCKAINDYGTSISMSVTLKKAVIKYFPDQQTVKEVIVTEGNSVTLDCRDFPTGSVPAGKYDWVIRRESGALKTLEDGNGRKTITSTGSLVFTYVAMNDATSIEGANTYYYYCSVKNTKYGSTNYGSPVKLVVNKRPDGAPEPSTTKIWTTKDSLPSGQTAIIGLHKKTVEMKCIFAGRPNPNISWNRGVTGLPSGRYRDDIAKAHQVLQINNLAFEDSGEYTCQSGSTTAKLQLKVEAKPYWMTPFSSVNVTEGKDLEVNCDMNADPKPTITFMINGKKLSEVPNDRRVLTGKNTLKFSNLNRTTDLQVVQCHGENKHGELLGDKFINVLKKTLITTRPVGDSLKVQRDFTFNCSASGDPSTPLTFKWFRQNSKEEKEELFQDSGEILISSSSYQSKMTITTKYQAYSGTYVCLVTNGYSSDEYSAALSFIKPAPIVAPTPPPPSLWWIGIIVGGVVLMIVIIIIIVIVRRNTEVAYRVDSKERKAGHDPEKEIADSGFHDYNRPDAEPVGGSRASLTDSVKPLESDEDSMAEYGDIDTGKFNEDGSFIGLYTSDKKGKGQNNHQNHVQSGV